MVRAHKLDGRKIVYKKLGRMITFEGERGLVTIRDLNGKLIHTKSMLSLVDLTTVVKHEEAKGKRKTDQSGG